MLQMLLIHESFLKPSATQYRACEIANKLKLVINNVDIITVTRHKLRFSRCSTRSGILLRRRNANKMNIY